VGSEDELLRLAGDGLDPSERVWVAHYFSYFGSTWEQRIDLRADMAEAGFGVEPGEIGMDEEVSGDEFWHLLALHAPSGFTGAATGRRPTSARDCRRARRSL
jgi:hypothetical protein